METNDKLSHVIFTVTPFIISGVVCDLGSSERLPLRFVQVSQVLCKVLSLGSRKHGIRLYCNCLLSSIKRESSVLIGSASKPQAQKTLDPAR